MKNLLVAAVIGCGLVSLGVWSGVVGIHYPRIVEDQPLLNPLKVTSVDGSSIVLEDGRVIALENEPMKGNWEDAMNDTHYRIEVESGGGDTFMVFGNQRDWVCGTPWARAIRIPLIADDVYRNRRRILGFGTLREHSSKKPENVSEIQ